MNNSFRCRIAILVVVSLKYNLQTAVAQIPKNNRNTEEFSKDLIDLLKGLGSLGDVNGNRIENEISTTAPVHERILATTIKTFRRNQNLINTQKAALRDILMMKLVSYYEDKYKLAHHDTITATTPALRPTVTYNYNYDYYTNINLNRPIKRSGNVPLVMNNPKQMNNSPMAEVIVI